MRGRLGRLLLGGFVPMCSRAVHMRRRRIDDIWLKEMRSRTILKHLTPPDSSPSSSRCKRNGFQPRMGTQDEGLAAELDLSIVIGNGKSWEC